MKFYHIIKQRKRGRKETSLGLTIAVDVSDTLNEHGQYDILCGVSYCAPVERCFSRPRGRLIASERVRAIVALPPNKRFAFSTDSLKGLKHQALIRLKNSLNSTWMRRVVSREINRLEIRREAVAEHQAKMLAPTRPMQKPVVAKVVKGDGQRQRWMKIDTIMS